MNLPYFATSLVYQFEFLCSLTWSIVSLTSLSASVENVDPLGRLFTSFGSRSWETTVTCHHLSEPSLTPTKFRCSLLFHSLNSVNCVLTSCRAVAFDLSWSFYHVEHLRHSTHCGLVFMRVDGKTDALYEVYLVVIVIYINILVEPWQVILVQSSSFGCQESYL